MDGSCPCGAVTIAAPYPAPLRFFCHCTICQGVYRAPYADITAFWTWVPRVTSGPEHLRFIRRAWFPASVKRGVCAQCEAPVIGHLQVPVPGLSFVPSARWTDQEALPSPTGHVHYGSRVADVDDDLPKIEGVWRSELVFTAWALPRLVAGRRKQPPA